MAGPAAVILSKNCTLSPLSPYDVEIGVSRDVAYPIMTGLHEFGHHVRHHLHQDDFAAVVKALKQTPEAQMIKEVNHDPAYWLHENELFARAYAQWVVESVNHPEARAAKEELQNILGSAQYYEQFSGPVWKNEPTRQPMALAVPTHLRNLKSRELLGDESSCC